MEIVAQGSEVQTNANVNAMTADGTKMAKLYFMMSHSLYADKKMSILRELSSNCRDAHKEAGKLDTPFAIVAPTAEHPYLMVSDVGTGLTYGKAQETILMFLGSTKDTGAQAGDFIGGWGIGAKSPRAYRPDYQVILRKDGVEATVQVFNDENGFPNETLLMTEPTNKSDGVDIVVPVFDTDVKEWRDKVVEYVGKTNYNLIAYMGNGVVLRPAKPFRSFDYEGFSFDVYGEPSAIRTTSSQQDVYVVYGGMRYDIPSGFNLWAELKRVKTKLAGGLRGVIRVERPDALKFGLSREALDLEPNTKGFLTNAVMSIAEDLEEAAGVGRNFEKSKYLNKWSDVEAQDKKYRELLEEVSASRLAEVSVSASCRVDWNPEGLKQQGCVGARNTLKPHDIQYLLPLNGKPKIRVLYSDKRPTMADYHDAAGLWDVIVCPLRSHNLTEVAQWAESQEDYEGLEFDYRYVASTRAKSTGSRRMSKESRGTITCAERGKRYRLTGDKTYVAVDSAKDFWIEGLFSGYLAFVPTKTMLKSGLPEDDDVVTLQEFLEDEDTVSRINDLYSGWEVPEDTVKMLEKVVTITNRYIKAPEAIEDRQSKIYESAERLWDRIVKAKDRYKTLIYKYPEATPQVKPIEGVMGLLKVANDHIYVLNKYEDVFNLYDFEKLKEQLDKGNPEAKRLVCAMRLEEFL